MRMRGSGARESVPCSVSDHTDTVKIIILGLTLRVSIRFYSISSRIIIADIPAIDQIFSIKSKINKTNFYKVELYIVKVRDR